MKCKIKLEIAKILTLELELSAGKEDKEKEDVKKEPPAANPAPSK